MHTFEGIAAAADAVRKFYYINEAVLPTHVKDKLQPYIGTGSSPVDLIVRFSEAVYANQVSVAAGKDIAAGCALICEASNFHGMAENSRGYKMAQVMDGQPVTDPPEPKEEYKEPPADPAPVEPAPSLA